MQYEPESVSGSSPHTRGAPERPAACQQLRWDHPRIRGEHVLRLNGHERGSGIIPAYAGSTFAQNAQQAGTQGSSPHTRGALF